MAMYRYIELAEYVLRQIPKTEINAVLIAVLGQRKDAYLLQHGNFTGDVWWTTPDGESVFNCWRVSNCKTQAAVYKENDKEDGRHATALTLATPFTGAKRFIIAGSEACLTAGGPKFLRVYEWTENKEDDAFPENNDNDNMLKLVPATQEDIEIVKSTFENEA